MLRKKRGQSILEYVIILTAIVAAIIIAAGTWIKPAVDKAMKDAASTIESSSEKLPK